jgi:hypothetical protein
VSGEVWTYTPPRQLTPAEQLAQWEQALALVEGRLQAARDAAGGANTALAEAQRAVAEAQRAVGPSGYGPDGEPIYSLQPLAPGVALTAMIDGGWERDPRNELDRRNRALDVAQKAAIEAGKVVQHWEGKRRHCLAQIHGWRQRAGQG